LALGFLAVTTLRTGFHLDRLTEFLTGCCALLGLAWEGEVWDFMHRLSLLTSFLTADFYSASKKRKGRIQHNK
jgi:hypothetical protein